MRTSNLIIASLMAGLLITGMAAVADSYNATMQRRIAEDQRRDAIRTLYQVVRQRDSLQNCLNDRENGK